MKTKRVTIYIPHHTPYHQHDHGKCFFLFNRIFSLADSEKTWNPTQFTIHNNHSIVQWLTMCTYITLCLLQCLPLEKSSTIIDFYTRPSAILGNGIVFLLSAILLNDTHRINIVLGSYERAVLHLFTPGDI